MSDSYEQSKTKAAVEESWHNVVATTDKAILKSLSGNKLKSFAINGGVYVVVILAALFSHRLGAVLSLPLLAMSFFNEVLLRIQAYDRLRMLYNKTPDLLILVVYPLAWHVFLAIIMLRFLLA